MSLILLLCLVLPWACVREKNADQTNLIIGALIIVGLTPVDYGAYFDRADYALQAWNIGLQAAIATPLRNLDPAGYNPKNWIAITGDDCAGDPGVPSDFQGAGCPFPNSSVIGVCQIRTWSGSGDIADVTLVVRRSFQDSSVKKEKKRAARRLRKK